MNDTIEAVEDRWLVRFLNRGVTVLEVIALVALLALMVHTLANVIGRRFFGTPLSGTIEYVGFWYLPIAALLGFVVAQFRGEHIKAPLIYGRLSKESQRDVAIFGATLCAVVCAAYTWYSGKEALENIARKAVSGALEVPIWPVTLLVPIVFAILTVQFIAEGVSAITQSDLPKIVEDPVDEGPMEAIQEAEKAEFARNKGKTSESSANTLTRGSKDAL